jgi:hypothetical protein
MLTTTGPLGGFVSPSDMVDSAAEVARDSKRYRRGEEFCVQR